MRNIDIGNIGINHHAKEWDRESQKTIRAESRPRWEATVVIFGCWSSLEPTLVELSEDVPFGVLEDPFTADVVPRNLLKSWPRGIWEAVKERFWDSIKERQWHCIRVDGLGPTGQEEVPASGSHCRAAWGPCVGGSWSQDTPFGGQATTRVPERIHREAACGKVPRAAGFVVLKKIYTCCKACRKECAETQEANSPSSPVAPSTLQDKA